MFAALFLVFSVVGHAFASSSVTWLVPQRSAIIKLDTPGYPLWVMDKANAPMLHKDSEKYYWATDKPSAVLLNLTMSHDNKTLLLNHHPILPLRDSNTPPLIEAYQIPGEYEERQIKGLVEMGLLKRHWEGLTLAWRYLALDYDRLVWSDAASDGYSDHAPVLLFRIMGLGAHSRSDVLEPRLQKSLQIVLADQKHGYAIENIGLMDLAFDGHSPIIEPEQEPCTLRSWRCEDIGLYKQGAPWYRFIWRERFDQYGRIGSLRHALFSKVGVLGGIWADAGPALLVSLAVLMTLAMLVVAGVIPVKKWRRRRQMMVRRLAEDDSLLGEGFDGQSYFDKEEEEEEEEEVPPPLPPRPAREKVALIDLEVAESRTL